jgi:ribosomal protein S18 acetylase RimI-like enzyme
MKIEHRLPTAMEFANLRIQTDWGVPDVDVIETVLARSFSGVVAMEEGKAIGMARTVGDGHLILYLQDVVIAKAYRNRGIGKHLIQALLQALDADCSPDCTVGLFAAIGQTGFYEGLGFKTRGNTAYGPGMHAPLSDLAKSDIGA